MEDWRSTVEQLQAAVDTLQKRVDALEKQNHSDPARTVAPGEIDMVVLERLRQRKEPGFYNGSIGGSLVYATVAQTGAGSVAWHVERPVPALLSFPIEQQSQLLAALGHPTRLQLIITLLKEGPCTSQTLQEAAEISSVGQFYHHLKELQAVDLINQPQRSLYEVVRTKVAPLLAIFAANYDLLDNHGVKTDPPSPPTAG